jgi:hypothetical protein
LSTSKTPARKKQRAIVWSSAIAALVLIGGIANACDSNTSPPSQPLGSIDTVISSTDDFATTVEPATTTTTMSTPPPVTEVPQDPVTQAVAPPVVQQPVETAADCGGDSYVNSDGQCVHDPVTAGSAPAGATAKCNDGTYSFSKHHSGTCSGHHGVAEWLN